MNSYPNHHLKRLISKLIVASLWLSVSATAYGFESSIESETIKLASTIGDEKRPMSRITPKAQSSHSSWAFAFDNDILTPMRRDQDYTYGFSFTYTGGKADEGWYSAHDSLRAIDHSLQVDQHAAQGPVSQSIEAGLFGFTPEDISPAEANADDRPYASLVYLSSVREQIDIVNSTAWKTTLTVGLLGLDIVGELQNILHDQTNSDKARGWDNQISDGGEITARYAIARQQYLGTGYGNTEMKSTFQASIGYLTEVSWSLSFRSGQYYSVWSSFNPDLTSYGEKSTYTTNNDSTQDRYLWAGVTFKARAYNAFLQGQMRDSAVTYRRSELKPVLVEAWVGYTLTFSENYRFSYVLRGHTSEIRQGAGDRALVWGGLIVSKIIP